MTEQDKKKKAGGSMVAPKPIAPQDTEKKKKPPTVEEMAVAQKVPAWQVAGMMRMMRFAPGKVLTASEFDAAVEKFMKKPMGGNCK